jgi:hypothetical protein
MSGVREVRHAIVTRLRAIDAVGEVQAYQRYAHAQDKLRAIYKESGDDQLCGWFVTRLSTSETARLEPRSIEQIHWRIQGVMALNDAEGSELDMDHLIEAIRDAFRNDDTLGDTVATCTLPGGGAAGIQLDDCGPVMFAGVLCHGVRLSLHTIRYLTMRISP